MSLETKKIFFQKDNSDTTFTNNRKKPIEIPTPKSSKVFKPLESIAPKFYKGGYNPNPMVPSRAGVGSKVDGVINSMAPGFYGGNSTGGVVNTNTGYFQVINGLSYFNIGYFFE